MPEKHRDPRVLFILKKRFVPYGDPANDLPYAYQMSSGLLNSATFVKDMLVKNGFKTFLVEVEDNNRIDAAVNRYQPTHVIIEAYWVVPEKFAILTKLYPNVIWIVRSHSEIPFIASEGISMEWTQEYLLYPNVILASNSMRVVEDFRQWIELVHPLTNSPLVEDEWSEDMINESIIYLPNYYPVDHKKAPRLVDVDKGVLDVGCFGAMRPMKNHLLQAFAAVKYAIEIDKPLRFHINSSRVESGGDRILKNVRSFFSNLGDDYQLIEHEWMDHLEFKKLVASMDIGLQVSFSETFNIVTADFVDEGVPIVVSDEVKWMPDIFKADMTESDQIVEKMGLALWWKKHFKLADVNRSYLQRYVKKSEEVWMKYLQQKRG